MAAPTVKIGLLAVGVLMPPFGRLDVNKLVDVERTPYPSAFSAFRRQLQHQRPTVDLSISPRLQALWKIHAPFPQWDGILVVFWY
jgi:hypothetical protein